jgi:two-component system, NtrC family, sensor histidine kinase PilS
MQAYAINNSTHDWCQQSKDRDLHLIELIVVRVIVLLLWLNFSHRLGLLPEKMGGLPFLPFFNILTLSLTLLYLIVWFTHRYQTLHLCCQIGIDLLIATLLVAYTKGSEGPFVSLYLLIIIYNSLALGRNGGLIGAALSTILYSGVIISLHFGFPAASNAKAETVLAIYRTAVHALSFWAVACLGMYLHRRLGMMERALAEHKDSLTRLKHLNEHIVSSIRSGLITTDLQGIISVFNTAAKDLTGRDPNDVFGKPITQIIGDDFWNRIREVDLLKNAKPLRHEVMIPISENTRRFLGFSVSPLLDNHRHPIGYIFSFQDLTDIKRLEEEVRIKEHMAAIGQMVAGIAHEIRNPLSSMRGSAEILKSHANLPEKDEGLLNILICESDRLNAFIEDFINFARPKIYSKKDLDLVSVLKDSVTLLKNNPEIRDKYFIVLNMNDPEIHIKGNSDQLNQVFWNLAQNAIRAMPDGGSLTIHAEKISDELAQVVFQDTGIGMSSDELAKVFQPFHSGFSGGVGLGLSIVFRIMEDHRGKIFFESEYGKGTKAVLRFPLIDRSQESESIQPTGKG